MSTKFDIYEDVDIENYRKLTSSRVLFKKKITKLVVVVGSLSLKVYFADMHFLYCLKIT